MDEKPRPRNNIVELKEGRKVEKRNSKVHLDVAILLEDIQEAKELSNVFRNVDVVPHFYDTLNKFWHGTLSLCPSLAIVDVKLMSDGQNTLANHPLIKSESLPIAFYYSDSTVPLLQSTYEIPHLGLIKRKVSYQGQVKRILQRANKIIKLEGELKSAQFERKKLRKQLDDMVEEHEKQREDHYYHSLLRTHCLQIEQMIKANGFLPALGEFFDNNEFVSKFSILELGSSGQRLISPKMSSSKFVDIPSLWLGQTCKNGIEYFAQNLANQVAIDILGGDIMSINITARHDEPEILLILQTDNERFLKKYDWEIFENFLSGVLSRIKLAEAKAVVADKDVISPWDLMSQMDAQFYLLDEENATLSEIENAKIFIEVNFSKLLKETIENSLNRFYWGKFSKDLMGKLKGSLPVGTGFCLYAGHKLFVVTKKAQLDSVIESIKLISARFSFWRYFEDSDKVFTKDFKPNISIANYATSGLIRSFERDSVDYTSKVEKSIGKNLTQLKHINWMFNSES